MKPQKRILVNAIRETKLSSVSIAHTKNFIEAKQDLPLYQPAKSENDLRSDL